MTDCTCPDTWTRQIGLHVPGCTCPAAAYLTGTSDAGCPAHGTGPRPRGAAADLVIVDDPWLPAAGAELEAPRQQGRGYRVTDRRPPIAPLTVQRIAAAFDVPLADVDTDRLRAELELRRDELDRWCDEGGPDVDLERPLPPRVVELRADATRFIDAMRDAGQRVFDVFRQLAEAFVDAGRQLARAFGIAGPWTDPAARRWAGDVPPRRWRDWLPAVEPKVDRARREQLDRQLRTLKRRAARRRRNRTRKAAPFYAIARAGRHGAAGLTVLRDAAAAARDGQAKLGAVVDQLGDATAGGAA